MIFMKKQFLYTLLLGMVCLQYACEDNSIKAEREEIRQYLSDNNKLDAAIETDEGVFVIITQEGTGTETPTVSSTVNVKYKGTVLEDGTVFDDSFGETRQFALAGLIQGWQIGMQEFTEDSKGEIYIPSALGYGEFGRPNSGIPGGAILMFEIELVDFFN